MKRTKFWIVLLSVIAAVTAIFSLCACDKNGDQTNSTYYVAVDTSKSFVIEVGDEVDYKQYFTVADQNGNQIVVTDSMIDTSKADTTKEGQFTVTLKIGDTSKDLTFTVVKKSGADNTGNNGSTDNTDNTGNNGNTDNTGTTTDELKTVIAKYADSSTWNFAVKVVISDGAEAYEESYEYLGNNISYTWEDDYGDTYTDYLGYEASADTYYYYLDNGDGTYEKYAENTDDYWDNYLYMDIVYLSELGDYEFTASNGGYTAKLPNAAGNAVLGEYENSTWTSFTLTISNGNIVKIVAASSDGYTSEYIFSKHGTVSFTLPQASSSTSGGTTTTPTEPTGTMEKQTYDKASFDEETLQDKLTKTGDYPDPAIGLPSKGTYDALVIPVQFSDTTISATDLSNLNIAFNGTSEQTGWESVASYYQKASYGKLNLSFDIAGYNMGTVDFYKSSKSSSYYASHKETDEDTGEKYNDGDNLLLQEVLAHYESILDLTKYDTNEDGTIDAVYLIYSAPVDYKSDDSFYWAYVTWDFDTATYDGMDAFYYLFAGLDFMVESVQGKNTNSDYPIIPGLKVNAATYIHETGHLLGLDDYYDYYENEGSDEGLGGADMMDYTVGDQNVYSKMMLGWLTPQIVTSTATVTIKSSQAEGDAILIPLNFNNSYFCEYLLIDLYSAQGLNELHASTSDSYLYEGADYGVRIYHVSSWIENAYDNDYGSFTDNNNSLSDVALIKLVEADGETKFASTDGYAAESDLWQKGDKLSKAFPKYTTYGGKLLIFDITIDNVSATEATITITYNA